jgi:hypothetical protein
MKPSRQTKKIIIINCRDSPKRDAFGTSLPLKNNLYINETYN